MYRYLDYCFRVATVPRVGELASTLSMSREALTRSFTAATGRSPAAAFRAIQIARAKTLLAGSPASTQEIARASAFGSTRAFYRAFLRETGMTPSQYRRSKRGGAP